MTTALIAWVHPHRCLVRYPLRPGEIRRMPHPSAPRTPFAFDLGCPACAARNTWIARDPAAPIVEGELVEVRPAVDDEDDRADDPTLRPWPRPASITTAREVPCVGCKRVLTIRDGALAAA